MALPGAYELPKEHATYTVHRVPSQSKFKTHYYLISLGESSISLFEAA